VVAVVSTSPDPRQRLAAFEQWSQGDGHDAEWVVTRREAAVFFAEFRSALDALDKARAAHEARCELHYAEERRAEAAEAERDEWKQAAGAEAQLADEFKAELDEARKELAQFYDAIDEAQRIDNTGGDSAVSVKLWSWSERRAALASMEGGGEPPVPGVTQEDKG